MIFPEPYGTGSLIIDISAIKIGGNTCGKWFMSRLADYAIA